MGQPVVQAQALNQPAAQPQALGQPLVQPQQNFLTVEAFQNFQLQLNQNFQMLFNTMQQLSLNNNNNNNNVNQEALPQFLNNNVGQQILPQALNNNIQVLHNPVPNIPQNQAQIQVDNQVAYGNYDLRFDKADIKFHPFMKHNPREWFLMLERRFEVRNVTADEDKYFNVVKNLPPEILVKVEFLLRSLPQGNKYETLKRALIDKFIENEETRINNFLSNNSIGTLRPSEFFEFLNASGSGFLPRNSILKIWLERLPSNISLLLDTEITEQKERSMIKKADKIFDKLKRDTVQTVNSLSVEEKSISQDLESILDNKFQKFYNSIASISSNNYDDNRSRKSKYYNSQNNAKYSKESRFSSRDRGGAFDKMRDRSRDSYRHRYLRSRDRTRNKSQEGNRGREQHYKPRDKSRDISRNRSQERSRDKSTSPIDICWFHTEYGRKAEKCQPPCDWEDRRRSSSRTVRSREWKRSNTPERKKNTSSQSNGD